MQATLERALLIIGIVTGLGGIGGICVWWVTRILDYRKEMIEVKMKRDFDKEENNRKFAEIKEDINELKEKVENLIEYYNRGRNN